MRGFFETICVDFLCFLHTHTHVQGLGFVVSGRVVGLPTLKAIFVAIFGMLSTLVPVILSMADSGRVSVGCEPTAHQIAQVQLAFAGSTCKYENLTVGSLLR